jgi:hypothetical protein
VSFLEFKDLVAPYAAIVSTFAVGWNVYLERIRKGNQRKALAGSLMAELEALEELYRKVELQKWAGENTVYNLVNIQEDYLIIFNSNCDKIGLFDNEDAIMIVNKYIYFKGYMDTLRLLSDEWRKFQERVKTVQLGQFTQEQFLILQDNLISLERLYNIAFKEQTNFYIALNEIKPTLNKHLHCQSKGGVIQNRLLYVPRKVYSYFK